MPDPMKPLPPGSRREQDLSGYEEMDLDALDRILKGEDDPVAKAKADAEEKAEAEEAAKADPVDPDPDEEEEDVADSDAADEAEEEEEEEQPEPDTDQAEDKAEESEGSPLEKRIRLLERRLELEGLERQKESEARKRAELLASRQAGRAGYLQQQLKQSSDKEQAKSESDASEDPWANETDAQENRPEPSRQDPSLEDWGDDRAELVQMAIKDEGNEFAKMHARDLEDMPEKFMTRLQELIREEAAPYAEEFKTSSIKTVRKLTRSLMASAYASARIEFADTVAENAAREADTRQADSVSKSKRRKAKAAVSKGSGRAKSAPKPKSYEDMSLEELEEEMKKEFGENYSVGSDVTRHGGL